MEASGLNKTILGRRIEAYNESTCENVNSILVNLKSDKQKKIASRVLVDLLINRGNMEIFKQKSKIFLLKTLIQIVSIVNIFTKSKSILNRKIYII